MTETEHPELLSFGVSVGGRSRSTRSVVDALTGIGRRIQKVRDGWPNEGLRINNVFRVPGPIFQPDYEGVRATHLDRKNQHLLVTAAVPGTLKVDEVAAYVADVLRQAEDQASAYLKKKKVASDTSNVSALIEHIVEELEAPAHPLLTEGEIETIGKTLERVLPNEFTHDEYWCDTGGYYVFQAYEQPVGNRILELRVWPGQPQRYKLVGYYADRDQGHSPEAIYAEGDGDLEVFLKDRLDRAIRGLRELGQKDITIPWPKGK